MPTYAQLMESVPTCLGEAGSGLSGAVRVLEQLVGSLRSTTGGTAATWQGEAQQAHATAVGRLASGIGTVGGNLGEVAQLAGMAADSLGAMVTTLRETSTSAEAMGFQVIPASGQVVVGPVQQEQAAAAGPYFEAVLAAYQAVAQVYTAFLASLVASATAADQSFAASIEGLAAQVQASAAGLVRPPEADPAFGSDLRPGDIRLDEPLYFGPDTMRGTGGEAYLTPDMIRTGPKPPVPDEINPAGYLAGEGPHAKGHVIADVLGGPLNDPANYATLYSSNFSRVNDGPMARLERRVKAVVLGDARGIPQQNVRYRVDMPGTGELPDGVRIHLIGDRGYRETVYLPNW